jgi:hypothetical protein
MDVNHVNAWVADDGWHGQVRADLANAGFGSCGTNHRAASTYEISGLAFVTDARICLPLAVGMLTEMGIDGVQQG